jgi:hypothetical protein
LLRRILNAHPEISCPPETNLLSACGRFLQEYPSIDGLPIGVLSGLAFSDVEEDAVLAKLRNLVFDFHREIAAKTGKLIWVEKTAFDIFYLEQIERLLAGHCRFICLCRHPLDVIMSVKDLCDEMDQIVPELHSYTRQHRSQYDAFAHAWIDCNEALLGFVERHPNDCLLLKYETLLEDSQKAVSALMTFIGARAVDGDFLDRAFEGASDVGLGDWKVYEKHSLDKSGIGRWQGLPKSTITRLVPRLMPLMQRLGYEIPKTDPVRERQEAIRRYRLGRQLRHMQTRKDSV